MTVQWFPGHMAKALRQVDEKLKFVDIVLELRDCRIPYSSSNPKVDTIINKKPRLIILNKADMADPRKTQEWIAYYKAQNLEAIAIDAVTNFNMNQITIKSKEILKDVFLKEQQKGLKERPIKAMIIGIPNVGKSTLINSLAKRKAAQTGDKPGVTKNLQWINVRDEMMLLDTPGVLWPKFEDQKVGLRLAVTGAIKDNILNLDEIALYAVDFLKQNYPEGFKERYKLSDLPEDNTEILDMIGKNRGCLVSGGRINYDKVYDIILFEIRNDKLGRLTFELPQDITENN
ncbi:MAG: ribosome biosis GTPase YlqF [Haloplasmataceae bacterium]|jgi:ribosome biogenesis GTPase A|nr:ribosome biosis GTPase YlqF [Haloplasmataceae bacterium]